MADSGNSVITILAILLWLGSMFLKPLLKLLADRKQNRALGEVPSEDSEGAEPIAETAPAISKDSVVSSFEQQLRELGAESERLARDARNVGGPAEVLDAVLRRLDKEHDELQDAVRSLPPAVSPSVVHQLNHAIEWQRFRLHVVEVMLSSRTQAKSGEMMADADAIAASLLRPFAEFCRTNSIPFPEQRPICIPAHPGYEAIWFGLLPKGYPAVFVPDDFGDDLLRWPSLAHELGHLLWNRVPRLAKEVLRLSHLGQSSGLFDPNTAQDFRAPYAAWAEEVFADFVATLQLGPSAVRGLIHVFGEPIAQGHQPAETRSEVDLAEHDKYAEHPPAQLRIHLALHLLRITGFDTEADTLESEWEKLAGPKAPYLLPASWGRMLQVNPEALEAQGRYLVETLHTAQLKALAQFPMVAIPGFGMGPGLWASTLRNAEALIAGNIPDDDARLLIAAAIEARSQAPALKQQLARRVSRAIVGLGEARRAPSKQAEAPRPAPARSNLLRDAIILREVLKPRQQGMKRRAAGRL